MRKLNLTKTKKENLARLFDALGHKRRIHILEILLNTPSPGMAFGALADSARIDPSVLAHHLKMMRRADLISTQEKGRTTLIDLRPKQRPRLQALLAS